MLNQFVVTDKRINVHDGFNPGLHATFCIEQKPERPIYDILRTYRVELSFFVEISCKDNEFDAAIRHAKRNLSHYMYKDILEDIDRIFNSVYDYNRKETMNKLSDLRDKIINCVENLNVQR